MLIRTRKAFTLLELVVAIVVLGILAALAVPAFTTVINNSKKSTATESALSISRDAVAIAATNGSAPTSADINSAISETSGTPVAVVSGSNLGEISGNAQAVKYTVTGFSTPVCVTMPSVVNGTPTDLGSTC